jgi:hypothetical protein
MGTIAISQRRTIGGLQLLAPCWCAAERNIHRIHTKPQ